MNLPRDSTEFCDELRQLLHSSVAYGRSGREFRNISLSTLNTLTILRAMLVQFRPAHTLEVGLCHGASCLLFADYHRKSGQPARAQHSAMDPFQTRVYDESGLVRLERAGLRSYVDFHQDSSSRVLPSLLNAGATFDLAYIDGSHLFEDVFVDFYYTVRLLSAGGVVVFDDCTDPHVLKVVRFVRTNLAGSFLELDTNRFKKSPLHDWVYRLARRHGKVQMAAFRLVKSPEREWNARFGRF